jgi:hypothetical protein
MIELTDSVAHVAKNIAHSIDGPLIKTLDTASRVFFRPNNMNVGNVTEWLINNDTSAGIVAMSPNEGTTMVPIFGQFGDPGGTTTFQFVMVNFIGSNAPPRVLRTTTRAFCPRVSLPTDSGPILLPCSGSEITAWFSAGLALLPPASRSDRGPLPQIKGVPQARMDSLLVTLISLRIILGHEGTKSITGRLSRMGLRPDGREPRQH